MTTTKRCIQIALFDEVYREEHCFPYLSPNKKASFKKIHALGKPQSVTEQLQLEGTSGSLVQQDIEITQSMIATWENIP